MMKELTTHYFMRGMSLALEDRITLAVRKLETAIAMDSGNWEALNVLGLCYYKMGEFSKSKVVWQESTKEYGQDNPAWDYLDTLKSQKFDEFCEKFNDALGLAQQGNYKKAIKVLDGVRKQGFCSVSLLNLLGLCFYGNGKYGKAITLWKSVLTLDKDNPRANDYITKTMDKHPRKVYMAMLMQSIKGIFYPHRDGI